MTVAPRAERTILHLDMDAFYASVEVRDDPSLKGLPVVVGGHPTRGVVLTCTYEARRFGVRSAMSMVEARSRCPQAIVVPPRFEAYQRASALIFRTMRAATPLVEGLSLDEAFLDVTESRALHGDGEAIARRLKQRIHQVTGGLTSSVGIAGCKFVAKVASDLRKPDGVVVCPRGEEAAFLAPLGVERIWGVGPKTAARLHAVGLATIGDLQRATLDRLVDILGPRGAIHVQALSRGMDDRPVDPRRRAKSIGSEGTFERDVFGIGPLKEPLLRHCEEVARRLRADQVAARALTVKIKRSHHELVTRRAVAEAPMFEAREIYDLALELLERIDLDGLGSRLIGISASDLGPLEEPQLNLFVSEDDGRSRALGAALDAIEHRFGDDVIRRAGGRS